jgi:hypothetical protein
MGVCLAFSFPAYFLGMQGLVGEAFMVYIAAVSVYWFIQALRDFRHPLDGALIVGLPLCLVALLMPAFAGPRHIHPL